MTAIMFWLFANNPVDGAAKAVFWILAGVCILQTTAELSLLAGRARGNHDSGVGARASEVMSLWFLTLAVSQGLAGQMIQFTHGQSPAGAYLSAPIQNDIAKECNNEQNQGCSAPREDPPC